MFSDIYEKKKERYKEKQQPSKDERDRKEQSLREITAGAQTVIAQGKAALKRFVCQHHSGIDRRRVHPLTSPVKERYTQRSGKSSRSQLEKITQPNRS